MTGQGLRELAPGGRLVLNGVEWTVESIEPHLGRLRLVHEDGRSEERTLRWLVQHPDVRPTRSPDRPRQGGGQPLSRSDLPEGRLRQTMVRAEHVREAATGFRDGHPLRARPGEPRAAYDPQCTTLTARRRAKVEEIAAIPAHEAEMLGLKGLGLRTLEGLTALEGESLLLACADGRWTRRLTGRSSVTEEIRQAVFAVKEECDLRARIGMRAKHRLLHQFVHEMFPDFPVDKIPSRWTLARVWEEWFGPGGGRQRYLRTAQAAAEAGVGRRFVVHRPGQVLALDSTPLPVKLRESVFGEPVNATLTLGLDLFTHSLPAFRLTLGSDTSVDVAMLLRDVMMPLPMREGWGEEMAWPYPGVPAEIIAEFAGHDVAGLPFFAPETVTTDHGGPYKNHDLVEAERELGCNILPARVLRQTDKFAVERAFGSVKTMLFEHLLGFTGTDVADRGADPDADACLTLAQMEGVIARWIVTVWQTHQLGEYAPAWGPGEEHSPNSLFAAAMHQGGWSMQIPEPELYYKVLRKHHVKIHSRRGVRILGLWYHADVLEQERFRGPSRRGGTHAGKWVVRSDRRDRRQVFFQDPDDHETWHTLRWTGLPPEGEVPAFSDTSVTQLLEHARRQGLAPRSEDELLPVLVELLSATTPVEQWPTRKTSTRKTPAAGRRQRAGRVRENSRGRAAEADRSGERGSDRATATVAVPAFGRAVDSSRRRRREELGRREPVAPPLLDDALRGGGLFLLPGGADDASARAGDGS
ncbi:transposase [Kitasatospora sp. NPDC090308]|uniref:transposase n=1 Tax=Kitasatospora sp. NPDC090308 TaxID=3364082 RepID=UPI00381417D9